MLGSLNDTSRGQFINILTQDLCICQGSLIYQLTLIIKMCESWGKVLWKHSSVDPQVFFSLAGGNCWPVVFFGTSNKKSLSKQDGVLSIHTTTLESTWSLCISSCRYFGAVLSALVMSFDKYSILTTTADYKWSAIWLCIYFYMCMFYVFLFIWFVVLL